MPFFISKPVRIEARQFVTNNEPDNANLDSLVEWIISMGGKAHHDGTDIHIVTLEGTMRGEVRDWIIRGTRGEFYPCKPDVFAVKYGAE